MYKSMYIILNILLLVILSIIIFVNPVKSEANNTFEISHNEILINLSIKKETDDLPIRLSIPKANIDTSVTFGELIDGTWNVNDDHASYAEGSSNLDDKNGNTIIYAHARDGLFINLNKVNLRDKIIIYGSDSIYEYEVKSIKKILPNDIKEIISVGSHNLTLFTCEGYGDEYRLLVKAVRISQNDFQDKEVI